MSGGLNLKAIVQNAMGDLLSTYFLEIVEVSDNEVLLKSNIYVIYVVASREGVSFIYFDTESKPFAGYNIFLFLVNRRRASLVFLPSGQKATSYSGFVEDELKRLVGHIRRSGVDILSGSKEWVKSYSWPIVRASAILESMM